jgi:hypothetical protein
MTATTFDELSLAPSWLAKGRASLATPAKDWYGTTAAAATVVRNSAAEKTVADQLEENETSQSLVSGRSATALTLLALQSVQTLVRGQTVDVTPATVDTLLKMFRGLIRDGGPLPQVGSSASGSVETHWLVGGVLVSLIVDAQGDWLLWGEDPAGRDLFEAEGHWNDSLPLSVALDARETLHEMGLAVRVWPDGT